MAQLYIVDSPITRDQRNNLNATFADIQLRFSNLRYQISILTGGTELDAIIQSIQEAIDNANQATSNTQQSIQNVDAALAQLQEALTNSQAATDSANQVVIDIRNEIISLQNIVNQLGNARTYDNVTSYEKNNVVEYNGSSFMAIQATVGNPPPTLPLKRNEYWQLLAQRGVDGAGSVSSVNNISPNVDGNITLQPSDLGATPNTEFTRLDASFNNYVSGVFFNVKNYGAVGDGVTDDTSAIQQTINAAQTAKGVVFIPNGTYRITSLLNVNSTVSIRGAARDLTIILCDNTNGMFIDAPNSSISDLTFTTNTTGRTGLRLQGDYLTIQRLSFRGLIQLTNHWAIGIHTTRLWYSSFDDIIIHNGQLHQTQIGYGIYAEYSVNNTVSNSHMLALDRCIFLDRTPHPQASYVNEGWVISSSVMITSNYGVYALGGTYFNIQSCVIDIIFVIGVYFEINGTGSVANNWVSVGTERGTKGIHIARGDRVSITGNTLVTTGTIDAIEVDSNYCSIVGNTINNANIGIFIPGNNCSISGNVIALATTNSISSPGPNNQIFNNVLGSGNLITTQPSTRTQNDRYETTYISLLSTDSTQFVDVPIPAGRFSTKPIIGFIEAAGTTNFLTSYLVDAPETTNTNARFQIKSIDGSPIGRANYRFSVVLARP